MKKEFRCDVCQKPHKYILKITSRKRGTVANFFLCRGCLRKKLKELGFEGLMPKEKEGIIVLPLCSKCDQKLASFVVESVYCGAPGFHYMFYFCDQCEAADAEAFERDMRDGRISWQWRREVRPIYQQ